MPDLTVQRKAIPFFEPRTVTQTCVRETDRQTPTRGVCATQRKALKHIVTALEGLL